MSLKLTKNSISWLIIIFEVFSVLEFLNFIFKRYFDKLKDENVLYCYHHRFLNCETILIIQNTK